MKMITGTMLPQTADMKEAPSNRLMMTPNTVIPEEISPRYQAQGRKFNAPEAKINCSTGPTIKKIPASTPTVPKIGPRKALPVKTRIGQHKPNKPPSKARIAITVTPNGRWVLP